MRGDVNPEEGDLPFLSNGEEEPGKWMAENANNATAAKPPAPKPRKRRTYSANGPLSPPMLVCLKVLARWDGPMTVAAIRELSILEGGSRNAMVILQALEARGMVDTYRPRDKRLPFYAEWRGLWVLTEMGRKAASDAR